MERKVTEPYVKARPTCLLILYKASFMVRHQLPFQSQNKKYYDFGFRFILFLRVLNQAGDSGLTLTDLMLPPPMEIWSNLTDLTLALLNSLEWQSCRHVSNVQQCLEGRVQYSYTAITGYDLLTRVCLCC